MQVGPGRTKSVRAGTKVVQPFFLEGSNWQCWGVLCNTTSTLALWHWYSSLLGHFVAYIKHAHNAQNGIFNVFEGTLAISYESYTLGLYTPNEGSRQ